MLLLLSEGDAETLGLPVGGMGVADGSGVSVGCNTLGEELTLRAMLPVCSTDAEVDALGVPLPPAAAAAVPVPQKLANPLSVAFGLCETHPVPVGDSELLGVADGRLLRLTLPEPVPHTLPPPLALALLVELRETEEQAEPLGDPLAEGDGRGDTLNKGEGVAVGEIVRVPLPEGEEAAESVAGTPVAEICAVPDAPLLADIPTVRLGMAVRVLLLLTDAEGGAVTVPASAAVGVRAADPLNTQLPEAQPLPLPPGGGPELMVARALRQELGLPDCEPHALRVTAATEALPKTLLLPPPPLLAVK